MSAGKICPISGSRMRHLFKQTVLLKYEVEYFICPECRLIQTEDPYWLDEAYREAIAALDTGILHRNIRARRYLEPLIEILGLGNGRFVDIGGGYGILTRLLRDIGYDCLTYDPHCNNIFARDFEALPSTTSDAVFAFEVLEHIPDPREFIFQTLAEHEADTIIFSTCTYDDVPDANWWYYAFDSGQHVSFYHPMTLAYLAREMSCHYYQINQTIHVITARKLGPMARMVVGSTLLLAAYALATRLRRIGRTKIFEDQRVDRIARQRSS